MMGMLIMAILWTILPMTGNLLASNPEFIAANGDSIRITWIQAFSKVFQSGPEGWGSVLVNVVFGAWFDRVLLETGIAATLMQDHGAGRRQARRHLYPFVHCYGCHIFLPVRGRRSGSYRRYHPSHLHVPGNSQGAVRCILYAEHRSGNVFEPCTLRTVHAFFLDGDGKVLYPYEQYVKWGGIALAVQLVFTIIRVLQWCWR